MTTSKIKAWREILSADRQYRKKPVVIRAFQFGVDHYAPDWWMDALSACKITTHGDGAWGFPTSATIRTLEGDMTAMPKDYIIQGIKGEIYPCKPDIFQATYEAVDGQPN